MQPHLFDPSFNGMPGSEMYRAEVFPDLFPHQKPMLVDNWDPQDREMYCGGEYTAGYEYKDCPQRVMLGAAA